MPFRIVLVPPGVYLFDGCSGISFLRVPPGVILRGSYTGAKNHGLGGVAFLNQQNQDGTSAPDGTIFKIHTYKDDLAHEAFCRLNTNSAVRGISFQWPDQIDVNHTMYQPHGFPYALGPDPTGVDQQGLIYHVLIEDIELLNAYQGIDLSHMVRHVVRRVIGQPFSVGIRIDYVPLAGGQVEDIQFNALWSGFHQGRVGTRPPIADWIFKNGTAFLIRGAAGQRITNCFALGYNIGVQVGGGCPAPDCQFQGLSTDTTRFGVRIDDANANLGLQFTNSFLTGETNQNSPPTTNGAAILISSGFASHVRFTNGVIWGVSPSVIANGVGTLLLSAFTFNDSQPSNFTQVPSVTCTSGAIIIKSSQFLKQNKHVLLGNGVTKAILMANIVPNPLATKFDVNNQMPTGQEGKLYVIQTGNNIPPYTPPS